MTPLRALWTAAGSRFHLVTLLLTPGSIVILKQIGKEIGDVW